jgi:hypothetical protein
MSACRVAACRAAVWRAALWRCAGLGGLALALASPAGPAGADPMAIAVLRTLDKVTARVSTIEVPVGSSTSLGSLEVTVRACDKRPPEETPESAAFLEVVETKPNEPPQQLFSGWMFASSPALSALEHPVYDIWVIDCVNSATTDSGTSP